MEENSLKGGKVRTMNIELTDELKRKENLSRLISAMHVVEETFGKDWVEQNLQLEEKINSQIFDNKPNIWGIVLTTEVYLEKEPYYILQTPARFIQNPHAQVPSNIPKMVFDKFFPLEEKNKT